MRARCPSLDWPWRREKFPAIPHMTLIAMPGRHVLRGGATGDRHPEGRLRAPYLDDLKSKHLISVTTQLRIRALLRL